MHRWDSLDLVPEQDHALGFQLDLRNLTLGDPSEAVEPSEDRHHKDLGTSSVVVQRMERCCWIDPEEDHIEERCCLREREERLASVEVTFGGGQGSSNEGQGTYDRRQAGDQVGEVSCGRWQAQAEEAEGCHRDPWASGQEGHAYPEEEGLDGAGRHEA